jgi:hypothetical protein
MAGDVIYRIRDWDEHFEGGGARMSVFWFGVGVAVGCLWTSVCWFWRLRPTRRLARAAKLVQQWEENCGRK